MTVETVTDITDLNASYPVFDDYGVEGDDHIRNIKSALLYTFNGFDGGAQIAVNEARINTLGLTTLGTAEAGKAVILAGDSTWTLAGMTCANLGTVTTVDLNGGSIDGAVIGAASKAAGGFTTLTATGAATLASLALASGATVTAILDEDTMSSDSATALATQQSIKAYIATYVAAQLAANPGVTQESATFNIVMGTTGSTTHTLGQVPDMVYAYLVCTDAGGDLGYSQGDKVTVSNSTIDANNFGLTTWASATHFGCNFEATAIQILHKTTAASNQNITPTKWDLVVGGVVYG